ncbi:MAG: sulfatase [Anaerolineae bacterium]|nr:sulfatase [Anaerolineae bacterium]
MKNVILIITDTYRYDNLGTRAERPVHTPELDRFLAEQATEIHRCYTGSFPTIPHRTDVARGVLGWPHHGWQPIHSSGPNHIAELFREGGYVSQLICDCPHLFNAGFQMGFDAAYQIRGQEGDKPLLHMNDPIESAMPFEKTRQHPVWHGHPLVDSHRWANRYPLYEGDMFPARTGSTAVRWLEENSESGPFFLWVDFFDPHEPWDPPEYMVRRYDRGYDRPAMMHPNYGSSSVFTEAELRNLWAHYAAEAELVDRWIGRILQKIDDLELWEDSIVVVTSDHGMSIGEHGRTGKSNISDPDDRFWPIYPEIGHVPFLIAGGDVPHAQSLDLIAQPIDIVPTVAELAGLSLQPTHPLDGRSFANAILAGDNRHREFAVTGCFAQPAAESGSVPREACTPFVVTQEWGYAPIGPDGAPELYDIRRDPLACENLIVDNLEVAEGLQALLREHLLVHGASKDTADLWRPLESGNGDRGVWAVDYPKDGV